MDKKKSDLDKMAEVVGGTPIYGMLPGSSGHQAGMRGGDILLSCNGMATPSAGAYVQATKLDSGPTRSLKVWRDGKELTFDIPLRKVEINEEKLAQTMMETGLSEYMLSDQDEPTEPN